MSCVPKKSGITVVHSDKDELIPTHIPTEWRVFTDYRKLNAATKKDRFPLPFIDQMLDWLAGKAYYCILDSYSGCMMAIFPAMIEDSLEVFMDDFLVYGKHFDHCADNLHKLKKQLVNAPIVVAPDLSQPFEVMCDANDFAVGAEKGIMPRDGEEVLNNKAPINEVSIERMTRGKDTSVLKDAETSKTKKGKTKADNKGT
ncbi:uncharacterized protein [Gossypium hirsutum]|uniref:Reverse transcriptase/retrotransposon-derived protein RNase H-like domain-containing protein n=1 Tax=Gossypium hirsutum TaxID=3635 RepID=A0A1U8I4T1_GOSHI|nr:uncharacterized protein LOC107892687 [Gossypium hirsutum]